MILAPNKDPLSCCRECSEWNTNCQVTFPYLILPKLISQP